MVRAKFVVTNIEDGVEGTKNITLNAVYSGSEENREFFKLTPSGVITLGCVNPAANEQFQKGKEFYVDFTSAA